MTDTLTMHRKDLGTLEPLGRGGTAIIYGLPDLPPVRLGAGSADGLVYKEYKQKTRTHAGHGLTAGLRSLVAFRQDRLADALRPRWDERIIWPLRMVLDDAGEAAGIVMSLIPYRYFQRIMRRSGPPTLVTREVEKLFGDDETMRRIGIAPVAEEIRLQLISRIVATYAMMHRQGVVVGDISGRNLVYDPAPNPVGVLALDADSARVEGTRSAFSSQPHTPQWEPPEALAALRRFHASGGSVHPDAVTAQSKRTDVYKFGLLAVRILDHGRGRSVNRDPAAAQRVLRRRLGPDAADLLRHSLADDPDDRPTMRAWYEAFHPRDSLDDLTARPTGAAPAGARAGSSGTRAPASTDGPVDGQVLGDWVFVAGSGWHRRRA
jgi:serine/threonine protein kinase